MEARVAETTDGRPERGAANGAGRFVNAFWRERHLLRSPLPPEECVARLRATVTPWFSLWGLLGGLRGAGASGVRGRVSERGFRLQTIIRYRNSFQTTLSGELAQDPEGRAGTLVRVRIGLPPATALFMAVLEVGGALLAVGLVALWVAGDVTASWAGVPLVVWLTPLFPLGILLFSAVLGRWLARNEGDTLLSFLCETLKAEEESPGTGAS
jgi:hypothetical protein